MLFRSADDAGPDGLRPVREGGAGGGRIVATGTPEKVAKVEGSYTGRFLAPMLEGGRAGAAAAR